METRKDINKRKKQDKKITRKQAIKKAGYTSLTAASMLLLLNNPAKAQSDTHSNPQGTPDSEEWW